MRQMALNTVFELAKSDPKVVFVGSDLGFGTLIFIGFIDLQILIALTFRNSY